MIKSAFKIAIRSLSKQLGYTVLNILGLTFGIATFLVLFLYLTDELQFDKAMDLENTYRLVQIQSAPGAGEQHVALTGGQIPLDLASRMPDILRFCRVSNWGSLQVIPDGENSYHEPSVFADTNVFDFFGLELLQGTKQTALNDVNDVVLEESMARKLYGSSENAMGKSLEIVIYNERALFRVSGIIKDQEMPSHQEFHILVSIEYYFDRFPWSLQSNNLTSYIKTTGTPLDELNQKLQSSIIEIYRSYYESEGHVVDVENVPRWYVQPIRDIHLHSIHIRFQQNDNASSIWLIYGLGAIAFIVVLIASINFVNIAIARSIKRAREVGLKKALGANKLLLILQFLGESSFITFFALLFGLAVAEISLPFVNQLMSKDLAIRIFQGQGVLLSLFLVFLFITLITGLFPAFYLARFQPASVLKTTGTRVSGTSARLWKGLVIFQFAISIILIFSVLLINKQVRYLLTSDIGINYKDKMYVPLQGHTSTEELQLIRDRLARIKGIEKVSFASGFNGVSGTQSSVPIADSANYVMMSRLGFIEEGFFDLMDVKLLKGRTFQPQKYNERQSVIINKMAYDYLQMESLSDVRLDYFDENGDSVLCEVIGVVEDHHYSSLSQKIEPTVYLYWPVRFESCVFSCNPQLTESVRNEVEKLWGELFPEVIFSARFSEETYKTYYDRFTATFKLIIIFTSISVIISILGMFGLSSFSIQQRVREIGIRKALGGNVQSILWLILWQFIRLVLIASIFALPIGWFIGNRLLSTFVYRVNADIFLLFLSITSAVLIATAAVLVKTLRAAYVNPAETVRHE